MSLPGPSGDDATRRGPGAVTTSVISLSPDLTATVKLDPVVPESSSPSGLYLEICGIAFRWGRI